jgi:hypothetical protein
MLLGLSVACGPAVRTAPVPDPAAGTPMGRGALIGAVAGLGLGFVCAGEEGELVSAEQCIGGYTLLGTGAGALIGLLVRSDVWAPVALPTVPATPPPVSHLP